MQKTHSILLGITAEVVEINPPLFAIVRRRRKRGPRAEQKQCKSALVQQSSATAAYTMLIFTPIIGRKLPCAECTHGAHQVHTNYTLNYTWLTVTHVGPNEHAAEVSPVHLIYTHADTRERNGQKENMCVCVYMPISNRRQLSAGQITARMCVSNKIPANYYYNDGFLEANWPPAEFIHLANVPYSVWRTTQVHVALSLAPRTWAAGNWPRELSVLHRWPPFTQFIIMLRQINPWEYYCSFGSSFLHTLAIYLLLESKIAGLFVLEEKARRDLMQIPPTKVFAFAGYLWVRPWSTRGVWDKASKPFEKIKSHLNFLVWKSPQIFRIVNLIVLRSKCAVIN